MSIQIEEKNIFVWKNNINDAISKWCWNRLSETSIYLWENNGMTKKIKHLEMIETIIERMAKNCFQLKTWTMTLLTAIAALFSKESDQRFMLFIFIPVIGFWLMDTFYLQMERKYRFLYKNVAEKDENDIDFNLDTDFASGTSSDMKQLCFFRCMFSITEMLFYPVILVATAVFFLIIFWYGVVIVRRFEKDILLEQVEK